MGKILSIEIKNRNIKILEGIRNGSSVTVIKTCQVTVQAGTIDDGAITDMDAVAVALENAFEVNKIKTKNAIIIINTNSTITRIMELPILKSKSETMSMIRNELEQLLPVDINQYKLIYKHTETVKDEGIEKGRYIVYGLPTNIYEEYVQLAERLKLNLLAIDLASNVLDKIAENQLTVNREPLIDDEASVFIDIGYSNITFSVICNGQNVFTRISSNGFSDLMKNYSAVFNVDIEIALEEVMKLSLSDYKENLMEISSLSILEDNVSMWVDEFNRYIRYYNSNNKDAQIQKIYVYGTYSNIQGLESYFETHLNHEIIMIKEVSKVVFKGNLNNFDIKSYFNGLLSIYIDKKHINFLYDKKKKHKSKFKTGVVVMAVSAVAILTVAYYGYVYFIEKTALESDLAIINSFISNEENIKLNKEALDAKSKALFLQNYIDEVEKLKTAIKYEDIVNSIIFEEISEALPLETKINTISVNKETIQIQCISSSKQEVAQFEKNLKTIEFIEKVFIPTIESNIENENITYSYSVVCDLKGVIVNEAK